jgi:hypothetical protein
MKLRLTGTFVLVLGIAALASASAYAGNGHGNGNNGQNDQAAAAVAAADGPGNSGNAPGRLKKDDAPAAVADQAAAASVQTGVKPANDTAKDTHAAASSDRTKLYGNGKTAGQIAVSNGAAPSTILHGPGNSQPHKASPCSGGHEVDVHALKGKRGQGCGSPPSSPPSDTPHSTPDPGKPGDPARGPNTNAGNTPVVPSGSPADLGTPGKPKPRVDPKQGAVEEAADALGATGAIGGGTLPFTGFPIWIVVLVALALVAVGLILRRRSGVSPS